MKRTILFCFWMGIVALGNGAKAQQGESFDNFNGSPISSSGSYVGDGGVTWSYTNCSNPSNGATAQITRVKESASVALMQQFGSTTSTLSQTDEWVAPPDASLNGGVMPPRQWHLTNSYTPSSSNLILTVIQLNGDDALPVRIRKTGVSSFETGEWTIEAELNPAQPPRLVVRNRTTGSLLDYGNDTPQYNGENRPRQSLGSTLLWDQNAKGVWEAVEQEDRTAKGTR